jgi:hypothetical protein
MSVGERVAFGEYVRARSGALLRAAQALTANRADAEDLLQATLVKAYQSWDKISDPAALDGDSTSTRPMRSPTPRPPTQPATATCTTWSSARSTGCRARCGPR